MSPRELPVVLNLQLGLGLAVWHGASDAWRRAELQAAGIASPVEPGRALDATDAALVVCTLGAGFGLAAGQAAILGARDATRRTFAMGLGWSVYLAVSTWRMGDHPVADRAVFMGVSLAWTLAVLAYAKEDSHALWAPYSLAMAILVVAVTGSPLQTLLLLLVPAPYVAGAVARMWTRGEFVVRR